MLDNNRQSLEQALAKTETDALATLKAAEAAMAAVRKLKTAAEVGSLGDVRASRESAEKPWLSCVSNFPT